MLQAIIRSSPLPIIVITPAGLITSWNPAAANTFGWTEQEVVGGPLPFIPPDKAAEHREMLVEARDLQQRLAHEPGG